MTRFRNWEGVSLSGDCTLEKWLAGDDSAAFFQSSLAPDDHRGIVKLVPDEVVKGVSPLDLWHRTRQLRHPNLVEFFDCGRVDHAGEIALYAVFEAPDDTLAAALGRSPLTPQEAREVLDSVLDALRYLHAQGLALGSLDAEHIVAVGDHIKLSTDALRDGDTSAAFRQDVRLLGELWQQALMPASPKSAEIAAHAADPDPKTRWTLAEIGAALNPPAPKVLPPPPPKAAPAPMPPVPVTPASVPRPVAAPAEVRHNPPVTPPYRRPAIPERAASHPFPKWILVGAAGVVLLILGLNRPHPAAVATKFPAASVPPPAEMPAPVAKAEAPKVAPKVETPKAEAPKAETPKAAALKPTVPAPREPSPPAGKEMWRVIAFTYRTREAAAKKVQQLNQYHPDLNATIFRPKDARDYYLVSLGGRRTHEEAVRLQHTARGKGLPRDLYVQNYSE